MNEKILFLILMLIIALFIVIIVLLWDEEQDRKRYQKNHNMMIDEIKNWWNYNTGLPIDSGKLKELLDIVNKHQMVDKSKEKC